MQPITLYWSAGGPNPSKVTIILEELGLPYQTSKEDYAKLKQPPFTDINPNGRLPALTDPNTGITLWESNAIISYLVDEYDKDHKISYASSPERHLLQQYSYFQASGQGPYFGQAVWFNLYHPEPLPSAKERYANEIRRVVGVLDTILKDRDWLVGDKCTWADLAFFPWNNVILGLVKAGKGGPLKLGEDEFPAFKRWMGRMRERESVKKMLATEKGEGPSSEGTRK